MRDPVSEISSATSVSIFSGNQFQGSGDPGNQLETGSAVQEADSRGLVLRANDIPQRERE
jgi:hypothetical protein